MKTFPANFTTQKNLKVGASSVWILKCPFATGTVYLSDMVFSVASWMGGITTVAWVKDWGSIDEDINWDMALPKVAQFSLNAIIAPGVSPNIEAILANSSNNIETTDLELYLWFMGLDPTTDPPRKMWVGNILDYRKLDELTYELMMVDQSVRLDKYIGALLDVNYCYGSYGTFVDPGDVGKVANIIRGDVDNVPLPCIMSGGVTTLSADLSVAYGNGNSFSVADGSAFCQNPHGAPFYIRIDDEVLYCASAAASTITLASSGARGAQGSTSVNHKAGAVVVELCPQYTYLVADHVIGNIDTFMVDGQGIPSSDVTVKANGYGQFPGKAHILVPLMTDPNWESISPRSTANSGATTPANAIDGDSATACTMNTAAQYLEIIFSASSRKGAVISQSVDIIVNLPSNVYLNVTTGWSPTMIGAGGGVSNAVVTFTKTGGARTDKIRFTYASGANIASIYEVKAKQIETYKSGTGSSAAKVNVGNQVTAHVVCGLSQTQFFPDMIISWFLTTYLGWNVNDFIATDAHTQFVAKGYNLSVLINEYKTAKEWLAKMAFQCRSYFRFANGKAYLLYRGDTITSGKTVTDSMIRMETDYKTTAKPERSPFTEIVNKVNIKYNRDWSQFGASAYRGISQGSDSASIARYGEKERADLFVFDFVKFYFMADDIRDFYLARYKDRRQLVTMEVFLDNGELEFADGVTLAPLSNLLCEVQKVNITPGSGRDMRNDKIQLVVKEY